MDALKAHRAELEHLAGDDVLLAAVHCQKAFGAERLQRSPREMEQLLAALPRGVRDAAAAAYRAEPEPSPEKAWERVVAVLVGADSVIRLDVERAIGGSAVTGGDDSCAARLDRGIRDATMVHCVVTDRRLVLADMTDDLRGFRLRAEVPRGAVLRARREGRFLQRGRVVIDFADLSQLALLTGVFLTRRADELVAALTGGTPR
ncbi:hypothetical protein [Dactylosporangium sp. NPDC005555]|uniref:hypothetical protein n=1 Tax=Dactylosporangium sp. NPDC005555 TaxID=3154889 RepID=UPI0033AC05C3